MKLGAGESRVLRVKNDALRHRVLGDLARRARDALLDFAGGPTCPSAHCDYHRSPRQVRSLLPPPRTALPPLVPAQRPSAPPTPPLDNLSHSPTVPHPQSDEPRDGQRRQGCV